MEFSKSNKNTFDEKYEEAIAGLEENFLEEDSYYEKLATPIKSAEQIKLEQKAEIKQILEAKELREKIKRAEYLIDNELPKLISKEDFSKIQQELNNSYEHAVEVLPKAEAENQNLSIQEIFGLSNESLIKIYEMAHKFIDEKHFDDAESVLSYLILFAPHVPAFWVALAIAYQGQGSSEKANFAFEIVQMLDPEYAETFKKH